MLLNQTLETLQAPDHEQQKRQVITAIKDLGLKVTCGDVAAKTALPMLKVNQLLNNVAYETQGNLTVDTAGGVTYKFAPAFESHYLINPSKHFFQWALRVAWNTVKLAMRLFVLLTFMLLRISFGILLVASVVLVVVVVIAMIIGAIASLFKDSDGGDWNLNLGDNGGSAFDWLGGVRFFCFDWLWDWWFWGDYLWCDPWGYGYNRGWSRGSDYYDWDDWSLTDSSTPGTAYGASTISAQQSNDSSKRKANSDSNFLDSCFSVLFGTADPNTTWDTLRWGTVARAIKAKSGVVLMEDLAPYLDATDKDENCMLPVLVRFNGFPEVSNTGKLIYVFPAFIPDSPGLNSTQTSTDSNGDLQNIYNRFLARRTVEQTADNHVSSLPPYLAKTERALIGGDEGGATSVFFVATIAIGGALFLLTHGANVPYYDLLRPVFMAITAYGGMFFLFPLMRWPFVMSENARIATENETRQNAAQLLAHPDALLASRQREAASVRTSVLSGEAKKVAYTTEEDSLEQQFTDSTRQNNNPLKQL